eukprot:TRINITY_DN18458_c0_g1_i1.p1 TRINITY_DN18458_c0_g1~~TRINITY_DN18458_c0_g1_i1.p1  ORF type:complete len:461 (+),score=118.23 TRINITY_DN18458_c0_g1_i1:73-1383(+)
MLGGRDLAISCPTKSDWHGIFMPAALHRLRDAPGLSMLVLTPDQATCNILVEWLIAEAADLEGRILLASPETLTEAASELPGSQLLLMLWGATEDAWSSLRSGLQQLPAPVQVVIVVESWTPEARGLAKEILEEPVMLSLPPSNGRAQTVEENSTDACCEAIRGSSAAQANGTGNDQLNSIEGLEIDEDSQLLAKHMANIVCRSSDPDLRMAVLALLPPTAAPKKRKVTSTCKMNTEAGTDITVLENAALREGITALLTSHRAKTCKEEKMKICKPHSFQPKAQLSGEVLKAIEAVLPPDAPLGHEAHQQVRYKECKNLKVVKSPIAEFKYAASGGLRTFQATLSCCHTAEFTMRVARAFFVKFQDGAAAWEVREFRKEVYLRIQEVCDRAGTSAFVGMAMQDGGSEVSDAAEGDDAGEASAGEGGDAFDLDLSGW